MKLITTIALLLCSLILSAQYSGGRGPGEQQKPKAIIFGKITDENGNGVPYASIGLYTIRNGDTALVKGNASDENGLFRMNVRPDRVFSVQVSFLSYETKWINNIQATTQKDLGTIVMEPNRVVLEEATIVGEKSQMELKLDKRVFNVAKDITNKGSNASEILEKVPSVDVDMDGNVSLRGSENVRILINGKPSGLLAGNLADALRQLNGDNIESIEVITNPSARFDAEGEVGIINIVMKKDKEKGTAANFNVTLGVPEVARGSANFSVRKKNHTIYGGISGGYYSGPGRGFSTQKYFFPDTTYYFSRDRQDLRSNLSTRGNLGFDWNINDQNMLNVSGTVWTSESNNSTQNDYIDYDEDSIQSSSETRLELEDGKGSGFQGNLNYYKSFKNKKGREWNSSLQYSLRDNSDDATIQENSTETGLLNQRSTSVSNDVRVEGQSDYIHPFGEGGKFEMGAKSAYRRLDNNYGVEQQNNGIFESMPLYDNHLIYTEHISSGYLMLSNAKDKFSYQLGLRGEYSDISTHLIQTDEYNPRQYLNWFPSVHVSYDLENGNSLQFSYSKRISRPNFWYLNPFFGLSDDRFYFTGNPNLDPSLTDAFELTSVRSFEKGSLMASAYYRHSTNIMQRILLVDSFGVTVIQPHNIGVEDAYGLEINGQYNLAKWWVLTGNLNFFRSDIVGKHNELNFVTEAFNWRGKMSSKWRLPKGWSAQSSYRFRAPTQSIQGTTLSMHVVDLAFSKSIFKRQGNVSISTRDLLNTRMRRFISQGDYFYNETLFQWRSRSVMMNFSYRINPKQSRRARRNKGGGVDHNERGGQEGM